MIENIKNNNIEKENGIQNQKKIKKVENLMNLISNTLNNIRKVFINYNDKTKLDKYIQI